MDELTREARERLFLIFDAIAGAPWFNRNVITERELIKLIVEFHRADAGPSLETACIDEAERRFSRRR
ncbi:hypothetical protein ACIQUG_32420 [Ensifer sp. NPDC090286]|uniref:hypothetical protein n=1 Tax=Ensifer sp. NPDC090286 TaxID=3363991 RepID=UPI00383A838A